LINRQQALEMADTRAVLPRYQLRQLSGRSSFLRQSGGLPLGATRREAARKLNSSLAQRITSSARRAEGCTRIFRLAAALNFAAIIAHR